MTQINGGREVGDQKTARTKLDKLYEILSRVDTLPRLDTRTEDEILGYGDSE